MNRREHAFDRSRRALGAFASIMIAAATSSSWSFAPHQDTKAPPIVAPPAALPGNVTDEPGARVATDRAMRIAVVGASASAGFGAALSTIHPDGDRKLETISFGELLRAAIEGEDVPILDVGSEFFFQSPFGQATRQLTEVRRDRATIVVGIDFLFWFVYGAIPEDARLDRLERGLAQLTELLEENEDVELVVGDVPDMSAAIGGFLSARQVPRELTRAAANDRIRRYATETARVRFFPLDTLNELLLAGEPFTIGTHEWTPGRRVRLIQSDRLHPTVDGMIALAQQLDIVFSTADGENPPIELELVVERSPLRKRLLEGRHHLAVDSDPSDDAATRDDDGESRTRE